MNRIIVKAMITETDRSKPVIRLFLNQQQKRKFLLLKGKQPDGLFTVIIL